MTPGGHEDVPSKKILGHKHDNGTEERDRSALYAVSAGENLVGEAGEGFFSDLVA